MHLLTASTALYGTPSILGGAPATCPCALVSNLDISLYYRLSCYTSKFVLPCAHLLWGRDEGDEGGEGTAVV